MTDSQTSVDVEPGGPTDEEKTEKKNGDSEAGSTNSPRLSGWPTFALVLLGLVIFAMLTWWTARQAQNLADAEHAEWARTVTVFDGVIGFVSFLIGALLGVGVTIQRVQQATKTAEEAKAEASQARRAEQTARTEVDRSRDKQSSTAVRAAAGELLARQVRAAVSAERDSASKYLGSVSYRQLDLDNKLERYLVAPAEQAREVSPMLLQLDAAAEDVLDLRENSHPGDLSLGRP